MSYFPVKQGQFEPRSPTAAKDCVAATTAQLINRATVDAIRTDHKVIRIRSGAPAKRGLELPEAMKAAASFGVALSIYSSLSRDMFRNLVAAGRAVGLLISCAVTRHTERRTNLYVGPHMVFVIAYSWWPKGETCACELRTAAAHGEFTIDDPGTTGAGYLQWSAQLVYRAAEAYPEGISCLATRDTEGRTWTARKASDIRSEPSYSKGKRLDRLVVGRSYTGGRTEVGDRWRRANGTFARGWIHVKFGDRWGWSKGVALA